jgi:hypothetical protein
MEKIYQVSSKDDDYGHCREEIVEVTEEIAKQYYYHKEVPKEDVDVIKKYINFVDKEEESERTSEERFYGNS